MKKYFEIKKWIVLCCLLLIGGAGFAQQVKVHIYFKDGTETETVASAFYFSDGFLVFSQECATDPIELGVIRKLVFEDLTAGIPNRPKETACLFPNPAQTFIQLSGIEKNAPFAIYASDGKLVKSGIYSPEYAIDISYFPKGFYLIKINASILKFVKL
jgi:hypothetical protein